MYLLLMLLMLTSILASHKIFSHIKYTIDQFPISHNNTISFTYYITYIYNINRYNYTNTLTYIIFWLFIPII